MISFIKNKSNIPVIILTAMGEDINKIEGMDENTAKELKERSEEYIKALAIKRGCESGLKYAEAFQLFREII